MVLSILLSFSVSFASFDPNQSFDSKVIYGKDNRLDLYQVEDQKILELADSTVGLFKMERLQELENSWKIVGEAYKDRYNLCSEERFYDQFVGASCTGFLVTPTRVATAGHCANSFFDCVEKKFIFGYGMYMEGAHPTEIPNSEVYSCVSVVSSSYEVGGLDYSIIELDRPVRNHKPLKLNLTGQIANSTPLFVIGHPAGLPTKVAGGANVRESDEISFRSDLDTYGGNSGSPVFNASTLEVEGILVRGEMDYKTVGTCKVSNVCDAIGECLGEVSTKVSVLKDFLN